MKEIDDNEHAMQIASVMLLLPISVVICVAKRTVKNRAKEFLQVYASEFFAETF